MDEKGTGTCTVSYELIAQAMCFPDGTKIVKIEPDESHPYLCVFTVKHTDLFSRLDITANLTPKFRRLSQSIVQFDGWGLNEAE